MNALILAAGYATRLYPLTLHKAKPLLEVAGKPMIEWVLDNLAPIPDLETVYVVTNREVRQGFSNLGGEYRQKKPKFAIKIIDDGSTDDSDKLGAIGDINPRPHAGRFSERRPDHRRGRQSIQRAAGRFRAQPQKARKRPWRLTTSAISRR